MNTYAFTVYGMIQQRTKTQQHIKPYAITVTVEAPSEWDGMVKAKTEARRENPKICNPAVRIAAAAA